MFNLTLQERKVILFLFCVALAGLGINFALKVNFPIVRILQVDEHIARINLNQASLEDIISIAGVTPKLARNIVAYRNTKGGFKDMEELKEVKGIGDYKYEKLKDLFFVD